MMKWQVQDQGLAEVMKMEINDTIKGVHNIQMIINF